MADGIKAQDRDLLIRTVIGEAGNQPDMGKVAVAHVVLNRLASGKYGSSLPDVVLAPSQFEPWANPQKLMSIDPNSSQYQRAAMAVDGVLGGQLPDVTGGATHFFAPAAQAALGRPVPAWAKGQGQQIYGHTFFAPEGAVDGLGAIAKATGAPTQTATVQQALGYAPQIVPQTQKAPEMAKASGPDPFDQLMQGATAPSAPAAPAEADHFDRLMGGSAPTPKAPPRDAKPGPNGLMWNADGGYDPKTGALVVAGKPMTDQTTGAGSTARSGLAGFAEGLPIVGPYAQAGVERGAAAVRAITGDQKYSDALRDVQAGREQDVSAHPTANTAGQIAGAVTGYAPLAETAIGGRMLGVTGPTMLGRMGTGAVGNALLSAADATVRDENPVTGAALGAAGGLAGPLVGKAIGAGISSAAGSIQNMLPTGIPGVSRSAANMLTHAITADDPAVVRNRLLELGHDAMLADAGPSSLGLAGALAGPTSEAKTVVERALTTRAEGSTGRIGNQLVESLGPAEDPQAVANHIAKVRADQAREAYLKVHENAPPVDAQSVVDLIDKKLETAEGMQKTALTKLRESIHEPIEAPVLNEDGTPAMQAGPSVRTNAGPRQSQAKPRDLAQFIRDAGGISDEDGELRHMGLSKLSNPKGMTLDAAREAAAEAGYLGADTDRAMSETLIHDLLDALDRNQTSPVYSVHGHQQMLDAKYRMSNPGGWAPGAPEPVTETKLVPKSRSENLHNLRQELDNVIEHDAPGLGVPAGAVARAQESLKAVRGRLDDVLKSQVPGMAEADAQFSAHAQRQQALEQGYNKVLGASGPHPETFAAERAAADPGVNIAQNKGIRGRIDRMFGTGTQRDAVTLNKLLAGGDDGYAAANLRTAFGDQPVNALLDTLAREKAFNATTNEVVHGSATARKTAAAKMLEESAPGSLNLTNATAAGMAAQAGKRMLVDPLMKMIMESPNAPRNLEIARVLTAQGASRDQILEQLLKLNGRQTAIGSTGNALADLMNGGANRLMLAGSGTYRPAPQ